MTEELQPSRLLDQETLEKDPILPRTAWSSELAKLRILLKAKQAIDRQEKQ